MVSSTRSERVHDVALKLALLIGITIAAFVGTREVALHVKRQALVEASALHDRGTAALRRGDAATALTELQRAAARDRSNPEYGLAFARALLATGQFDAADRTLRALRAEVPDHPAVNLELARLAARRRDVPAAIRYYRYALYAPWGNDDGPSRVREEFIRFLLDNQDRTRAIAELVAARATTPPTTDASIHRGRLFMEAGEPRLALDEARRALAADRTSQPAHLLAGQAEYALGQYAAAARDFDRAGELEPASSRQRAVAEAVVTGDPLAPRLAPAQRLQRATGLLEAAADRMRGCTTDASVQVRATALDRQRQALSRSRGRDIARVEQAIDAAADAIRQAPASCAVSSPQIEGLLIIAERQNERER